MSDGRTVRRRLPQGGDFNLFHIPPEGETFGALNTGCRQCLAALTAMLNMVIVGTLNGWTTISLHYLLSGTGNVPLTLTFGEAPWIVSLAVLGSMIGSLVGAQLAVRSGCKKCFVLCNTLFTLGWFSIYVTTSVPILYIARVILGIGVGIGNTVNPIYVSEIIDINIGGLLGFLLAISASTGTILAYTLGLWFTYESLLMALVILSFITFVSNTCFTSSRYFSVVADQITQPWTIEYQKDIENLHNEEMELRALRAQTRYESPSLSRSNLPSEPRGNLPSQSRGALPSQTSSELHQPSTSKLCGPATGDIHRPSTSKLCGPATGDIHRPSTGDILRPSTGELCGPSTSKLCGPATGDIHRPSTDDIFRPFTDELCVPATGDKHRPATGDIHRPSTDDIFRPSTGDKHRPSTGNIHRPSTGGIFPPSTCGIFRPSTGSIFRPSTSSIFRPSTIEINPEPTIEIHPEPTIEIHPEPTSEIHPRTRRESYHLNILTKYIWSPKLREILQGGNRKALFIMLGLIMAQQLSGNFITTQYLQVLLNKTTISIQPHEATILVVGVGLISGALSQLKVEYLERRIFLLLSTLGSCCTLIILASYLFLVQHKYDVSTFPMLPVIDLIIYQVAFQIGLGTLPKFLVCELFPTKLRSSVATIIVIFDGIIGFILPKLYQVISDNVGSYAIYYIFATSCFLAFIMVLIWVPETKGKTYHEIEALLVGQNLNSLNEDVRSDEMDLHRT